MPSSLSAAAVAALEPFTLPPLWAEAALDRVPRLFEEEVDDTAAVASLPTPFPSSEPLVFVLVLDDVFDDVGVAVTIRGGASDEPLLDLDARPLLVMLLLLLLVPVAMSWLS